MFSKLWSARLGGSTCVLKQSNCFRGVDKILVYRGVTSLLNI